MTNAQKWIAITLGVFLLLLVLGRLTEENSNEEEISQMMSQQIEQSSQELDGLTLIKQTGCISCHGAELQGTKMAPALQNLKEYWTRDNLINYLRNPSSFSSDKRFTEYNEKYKNIMMPSYNNIDVKNLGKMVDYLLTK
ncbi:MAG: cytochrome c [Melioribacteraceae bacterium]|nr:cytochrome c [Melioribacteraceae bacterium]